MVSPLRVSLDVNKSGGILSPPARLVPRKPVLSSALLAAALLTATLFFPLALLTFTLLSLAFLLLSALLAGRVGFTRFVWIVLCVHDAFLY